MTIIDGLRIRNRKNPLTREKLNYLVNLAQQGSIEARNQVVERNIGLVLRVAGKYNNQKKFSHDIEDYVQEGCFGLMRAIETYDTKRGLMFSTYATWWIRQITQGAVEKMAAIHNLRRA